VDGYRHAAVELPQPLGGDAVLGTDDDERRCHEVAERLALTEELRVQRESDVVAQSRAEHVHERRHQLVGHLRRRDRAPQGQHEGMARHRHGSGNLPQHAAELGGVGGPVRQARSADAHEADLRVARGALRVLRGDETSRREFRAERLR
jgi:hypothetical protein